MNSYQQCKDTNTVALLNQVRRLADSAYIPFDKLNRDYVQFKSDLAAGATLQDATGAVMTATQVQAFLAGLP